MFSRLTEVARKILVRDADSKTGRLSDMAPRLSSLDGMTLRRAFSYHSMGMSGLVVMEKPKGSAEIHFMGTVFSDLPEEVHNVRFRCISPTEVNEMTRKFSVIQQGFVSLNERNTLLISCTEGDFHICALNVTYPIPPKDVQGFYKLADNLEDRSESKG